MMTSKQIEELAVNAVKDYFTFSETISPYISDNDKEPCWDGNLYLYSSKDKDNDSLLGRIPVQVKGKQWVKSLSDKKEIKYPVSLTNLKNYKRDGGIIYFVVVIKDRERTIYYAKLAPLDLKKYINIGNNQKQVSITLSVLPEYEIDVDFDFRNFYTDCKTQTGNVDNSVRIEDVVKHENFNLKFFINGIVPNQQNIPLYLSKHKVYLYTETTDDFNMKCLRPIGDGQFQMNVIETVPATICINGVCYYKNFKRMHQADGGVIIHIGECLKLGFPPVGTNLQPKVEFKVNAQKLTDWITQAQFALAIMENEELHIEGHKLKVIPSCENHFYEWCKKKLEFALEMQKLMTILNVNKELHIQDLKENEELMMKLLIDAIVYRKEVAIKQELNHVFTTQIANIILALSATKTPNGKYRIYSYKNIENLDRVYYTDSSTDIPRETSIYSWFQKEGFSQVSNIDYEDIVPSYQKILSRNESLPQRANNDMLMMIMAYDETKDKRLLEASKQLCEWLLGLNCPELDETYTINLYQIKKRLGCISEDDCKHILQLAERTTGMIRVACYILLEQETIAGMYLSQMEEVEQEFFKSLPIYSLCKQ